MEELSYGLMPVASMPLTQAEMQRFLAARLEQSSIKMYTRDIAAYIAWVQDMRYDPLSPQSLALWRDHLVLDTVMSPNTINRMLAAVKRVIREAATRERIPVALDLQFSRVQGVSVRALRKRLKEHARTRVEPEEMRTICELPDITTLCGLRDAAMLATLASSGCRIEELVTLAWSCVKRRGSGYYVLVRGKTEIDFAEAPLSIEAYTKLMAWRVRQPVVSEYVFTSFDGPKQIPRARHISKEGAWKRIKRYCRAAGLENVTPHDFRRFVGTLLAKVDLRKAQKALRHKDISTTARHYVLDELEIGMTDALY